MTRHPVKSALPLVFSSLWCAIRAAGFGASLATGTAFAQSPAAPPGEPAAAAVKPYVDRVMEGVALDDGLDLKASEYNGSGWSRSWRIDYSVFKQSGGGDTTSNAIGLGGFLDTPNYGSLSVNANLVEQRTDASGSLVRESGSTWRIDQRAFPLEGGWFANNSIGDISTGGTALSRGIGRVSVPSSPIRGLSTQLFLNDEVDLNASAGRTGLFNGFDVAGFETSAGRIASAGGQLRLPYAIGGGRSDAAFQLIDGQNISDGAGFGNAQNTRGFYAATSWEGMAPWASSSMGLGYGPASDRVGGLRMQANAVQSNGNRDGSGSGLWADAAWRTDRWRNTAGVFRFDPNLRWGTNVLASDLQGVYWQADTSTRQWQYGFTAELSDSVSGSGTGRSAFLNLNGRYRLDSRNSVGASVNLRTISSPGQAVQLSWDRTGDWGQTQWRADAANSAGIHTVRFGVDQNWPLALPASFITSLAFERTTRNLSPGNGVIWGLLATTSPLQNWALDASLRSARYSDGGDSLNANVGLSWQPTANWSLMLRYTESRGQEPLSTLVVSALTAATLQAITATQTSRSLQLLLRYEDRAGTANAPLGGSPGSGAGSLSGTVFYDADSDGKRQASEGGVPGVSVILDRRYVIRTDAAGRYEFPFVSAGDHLIEVSSDNVPLPWSPAQREPAKTTVLVRQSNVLDFAVQRDR
jgi:SdrD B-like domain